MYKCHCCRDSPFNLLCLPLVSGEHDSDEAHGGQAHSRDASHHDGISDLQESRGEVRLCQESESRLYIQQEGSTQGDSHAPWASWQTQEATDIGREMGRRVLDGERTDGRTRLARNVLNSIHSVGI